MTTTVLVNTFYNLISNETQLVGIIFSNFYYDTIFPVELTGV